MCQDSNNRTSESIKSQIETAKNFGVLRIYVYYMKSSKARRAYIETYKNDVVDTIDEKALKGRSVTQNVRLSKLVPTERPESSQKDLYYDRSRRHFAIFEFRYRSKGTYQSHHLGQH